MADVLQEAIHLVGSNSTGIIHGITAIGRDTEGAGRMPGGGWAGYAPGVSVGGQAGELVGGNPGGGLPAGAVRGAGPGGGYTAGVSGLATTILIVVAASPFWWGMEW